MSGKFCISLTCGKDNTDKATVAFVVANAAVASDKDTVVFLNIEGVYLSQQGYADSIHEEGFAPRRQHGRQPLAQPIDNVGTAPGDLEGALRLAAELRVEGRRAVQ